MGYMFEREGKVFLKKVEKLEITVGDERKIAEDILEIEQYLNGELAVELYKKYGMVLRFWL